MSPGPSISSEDPLGDSLSNSSLDSSYTSSSQSLSNVEDNDSNRDSKKHSNTSFDEDQTIAEQTRPTSKHKKEPTNNSSHNNIHKLRSRLRTVNHIWVNEFDLEFCSDGDISDASVVWSDYGDEVILDEDELTQYTNPFQFKLSKKLTYSEMKYNRSDFPKLPNYLQGRPEQKKTEKNKKLLNEGKQDLLQSNSVLSSPKVNTSNSNDDPNMKNSILRGKLNFKSKREQDENPERTKEIKHIKKHTSGPMSKQSVKQKIENWDNLSGFWRMVLSENKMIITPMNYSRQLDHEFRQKKEIVTIQEYETAREKCSEWIDKYSDFFTV
ncbi:unnamed protein product [Lepeophtheirus salmonis]|uniref:(salmon louse) hypothetical protein n=1 Tax=Lepeophtheirus salmonis TaxID=72036 RepID=A0A7R8CWY3_LEPSM|nr:unnamed protein product [Lepeophtheirus salmonis]CAF2957065.1 unnamed protein product [Lepeophtheirus salmonis]